MNKILYNVARCSRCGKQEYKYSLEAVDEGDSYNFPVKLYICESCMKDFINFMYGDSAISPVK